MTDVSEVPAAAPAAGNGYDAATVERARALIVGTVRSKASIAEEVGVPRSTIGKWQQQNGWPRPPGAPTQPPGLRRGAYGRAPVSMKGTDLRAARLINRLYRVYGGQVALIEARLAKATEGLEERDARALATLAKTLSTLMALERDDGARKPDPEAIDPDEIRAKLARRLYALGQSGE